MDELETPTKEKIDITCAACGVRVKTKKKQDGQPAVPTYMGWKADKDDSPLCKQCFKAKYVTRSLVFPVIGPLPESGTWAEFRESLKTVWGLSTTLANIAETELFVRDSAHLATKGWRPGQGQGNKMPALPPLDLYKITQPLARGWAGATAPATGLLRAVQNTYKAIRYFVHTGQRALQNFRYPYPYPVHNAAWRATWLDGKIPIVDIPLAGKRWLLKLKYGGTMHRQIEGFEKVINGEAIAGELSVYRRRASLGDHRNGVSQSSAGGGPKQYYRVMIKLAVYLPRRERVQETRMLPVATKKESFLQAADGFLIHADYVRSWVISHGIQLQRLADDTKFEKRLSPRRRKNANAFRADKCRKFHDRIKTFQQQTANSILKYAMRRGYAGIDYDDSDKSFFPAFAWAQFRQILTTVAENLGATVNFMTAAPPETPPEEEVAGEEG